MKIYQRKEDNAIIDEVNERISIVDYPILGRFILVKEGSVTRMIPADEKEVIYDVQ